jgi:hypothetical protein
LFYLTLNYVSKTSRIPLRYVRRTDTNETADNPARKAYSQQRTVTVGFGVNAVKIRGAWLYFSNSDLVAAYQVLITPSGYRP